jgi:phage terminase small subunit
MTSFPNLTVKQDKFAREYVKTGNGTQAAIAAGYSQHSAPAIASENLRKPEVSEAVRSLRLRLAERLDISRDRLLNNVAHIAEQAQIEGEHAAAIQANTLLLKAQGHLVERQLNMNVDVTQSHLDALKAYTDSRIEQAMTERMGSVTIEGGGVDAVSAHSHSQPDADNQLEG